MRSRGPTRSLSTSRPAATGNTPLARGSAVPTPAHRIWRTGLRQTDRNQRRRAAHSAAYRTDALAILSASPSPPTTTLAHSVGFPSPCNTLLYCQSILAIPSSSHILSPWAAREEGSYFKGLHANRATFCSHRPATFCWHDSVKGPRHSVQPAYDREPTLASAPMLRSLLLMFTCSGRHNRKRPG